MAINQHAANLIDTTVNAFNGEATSVSLIDGISLIDSWTGALGADDQSANPIARGLTGLKAELQSGNPDGTTIVSIINELANQATRAAGSADADVQAKIGSLTEALRGFSQQLSGSGSMAGSEKTQAPMTSTVGGESTHSGSGASTLDGDDNTLDMDDSTGSDGGAEETTTGPDTEVDMDDSTGSDGGAQQSPKNSSDSGDDNTDGSFRKEPFVQGMGVSGGTGDGDVSQSGGRSQY